MNFRTEDSRPATRFSSTQLTLPNFFIIGAAKAGTTSLHHYLDQHPQIQMAAIKETNFFSGPENGLPYPAGRVAGREEYEALFDPAYEVRGEASPSYTNAPRRPGVPERIKALVPEARFVYVVRDPIARTLSHHQMLVAAGKERRSLREALAELSRVDPRSFYLTSQSFYAEQLERYLRHFPQQRILVVDQAELRGNREATLAEVFAFLEADPLFTCEEFEAELFRGNDRRTYPRFFLRFVKPALARPARRLPAGVRDSVRRSVERALLRRAPATELDAESRARLEDLFAGEVERFRALTGSRLASWSV
jgi:hypothetical protein